MNWFEVIPLEITTLILSHLHCIDKCKCMCVSTLFMDIIKKYYTICANSESLLARAEIAAQKNHLNCLKAAIALHNVETTSHNVETTSHNVVSTSHNVETTSHNVETTLCNVCSWAVYNNNLEMLDWAHKNGCPLDYKAYATAVEYGNCVAYLNDKGFKLDFETITFAAKQGFLKCIRLAHNKQLIENYHDVIVQLSLNGHLECILYLQSCMDIYIYAYEIMNNAMLGGHLHIIKWIYNQMDDSFINQYKNDQHINQMAMRGYLDCLQFFYDNSLIGDLDYSILISAIYKDHIDVVMWIFNIGEFDKTRMHNQVDFAMRCGSLKILKWMFDNGFHIDFTSICFYGSSCCNLDMIKWGKDHGGDLGLDAYDIACEHGNVEILKYFHMNQKTKK